MIFEGDHSVVEAIKEKKRLMDAGKEHDHIRPLLIQGGGLMRGAYGAGASLALEELGYTNTFTSMVGISSGAPLIAYFAAGNAKVAKSIFIKDCADKRFVNVWRFWNQADTKYLINIISSDEKKKLDFDKVSSNPADLYIGVSEFETALPKLLKPKNVYHFFDSVHASINMQNVSPHKVIIDGVHYADGGFTKPHMFTEALKEIDATHILIITNNDKRFTPISIIEKIMNRTLFRFRLNGVLAQAINSRREERDKAIAGAMKSDNAVAVVWGDCSIHGMENNPQKIAATIEASRTWWHGLFSLEK
ncbi:hypothetical protein H6784_04915 [Candidatus Nomurabacteria bacterium]|nr:hypothetical protein [Candidatus Nomurabacteria bacterium]